MSLGSVMQVALSGMSAAETLVSVAANNLANIATSGFKQSRASFVTQSPQTYSLGSAPSASDGGSNPMQIGRGVMVGTTTVDFSQGTLANESQPLSLALEGDGFFILQGSSGERLYTRSGQFGLNANGEIVTSDGARVLGYGVDSDYQIQTDSLTTLRIPQQAQAQSTSGATAMLTSFSVGTDGVIHGRFSDGVSRTLGQLRVARFTNSSGLAQIGNNTYAEASNSGLAIDSTPGQGGAAEISAGMVELSNTDIAQNLIDMLNASNMFRLNAAVVDVSSQLLDDLYGLHRT